MIFVNNIGFGARLLLDKNIRLVYFYYHVLIGNIHCTIYTKLKYERFISFYFIAIFLAKK